MLTADRRLVKNKDFRRVYRFGHKVSGKNLIMYYLANRQKMTRFGFSISKKVGKAVNRNLLKRRLREICRQYTGAFQSGLDIVLVARENALDLKFYELEKEVLNLGRKGKILTEKGSREPGD